MQHWKLKGWCAGYPGPGDKIVPIVFKGHRFERFGVPIDAVIANSVEVRETYSPLVVLSAHTNAVEMSTWPIFIKSKDTAVVEEQPKAQLVTTLKVGWFEVALNEQICRL